MWPSDWPYQDTKLPGPHLRTEAHSWPTSSRVSGAWCNERTLQTQNKYGRRILTSTSVTGATSGSKVSQPRRSSRSGALDVPQAQRIGRMPAHAGEHHIQGIAHPLDHLAQNVDHRRGLVFSSRRRLPCVVTATEPVTSLRRNLSDRRGDPARCTRLRGVAFRRGDHRPGPRIETRHLLRPTLPDTSALQASLDMPWLAPAASLSTAASMLAAGDSVAPRRVTMPYASCRERIASGKRQAMRC